MNATDERERFSHVATKIQASDPAVELAPMFRAPGLRTGGSFFAFATGPDVVVKLPAPRVAELVADGRGRPCEIRRGSPLREWVRISSDDGQLADLVIEGRDFVRLLQKGNR